MCVCLEKLTIILETIVGIKRFEIFLKLIH